jgi:hypothetical protein
MGSEGSVPPPMGFHWTTPTGSWTRLGVLQGIIAQAWPQRGSSLSIPESFVLGDCQTLSELPFEPLDRRGFRSRGSFSEKVPSERVSRLLCVEDGRAFLGSFLGEVERALQRPWPDGTFRPWVVTVNAAHAHAWLARKKEK